LFSKELYHQKKKQQQKKRFVFQKSPQFRSKILLIRHDKNQERDSWRARQTTSEIKVGNDFLVG
jgi:hypothetical protein